MEKAFKRQLMEEQGQDILDSLQEAGRSPREVSRQFWSETYFKLSAEGQARFQRELKVKGFEPGDAETHNAATGETTYLQDWPHVAEFVAGDLPGRADQLEGTYRGYVAMMEWANRQATKEPVPPESAPIAIEAAPTVAEAGVAAAPEVRTTASAQTSQTIPTAKVETTQADPIVTAARGAAPNLKLMIPTGEFAADGTPVVASAADILARSDAEIAQAQNDAKGFEAAVNCFLQLGAG